jgi:hypothetical protein
MKKPLLLFLLITTSCASWNQFGSISQSSSYNFTIEFPEQWTRLNTHKYLMVTKDGPFSQYILVQQRHVEKPFKHTKKKINKGMLPQEAAEVILDEIISDRCVLNFRVIENLPARVNQYDGFRIVFTYKTKDGLKFKTIYYGFLQGEWFYSIRYNAGERHYSAEDIEAFRKVLSSFKIMEAGPA